MESAFALLISLFINLCVVSVFAKGFYGKEAGDIGLKNAGDYLGQRFGSHMVCHLGCTILASCGAFWVGKAEAAFILWWDGGVAALAVLLGGRFGIHLHFLKGSVPGWYPYACCFSMHGFQLSYPNALLIDLWFMLS